MDRSDWPEVSRIHQEGVLTGIETLDTEVSSWDKWDLRHLSRCRVVAVADGLVVGWAALVPVSELRALSGVAEVRLFIATKWRSRGVGPRLLERLIAESADARIWTLQALVLPENTPTLSIYLRAGFRIVGTRERFGRLHGEWRSVILLERRNDGAVDRELTTTERRAALIGSD